MTQPSVEQAFAALEMEPTADFASIRRIYLAKLHAVHPDKPGTDAATATPIAVRVLDSYKTLHELHKQGGLAGAVQAILKERQDFTRFAYTPEGVVPHNIRDAFPDLSRVDVVEGLGGGRYALWVQGASLEQNATLRAVLKTLRQGLYPGADSWSARVWLFVPGKTRRACTLAELEEMAGEGTSGPARKPVPELPAEVLAQVREAAWGRSKVAYVLVARAKSVQLFGVRRFRGSVDVQEARVYGSSAEALQALRTQGISPDLIPVWLSHSELGAPLQRLGAA